MDLHKNCRVTLVKMLRVVLAVGLAVSHQVTVASAQASEKDQNQKMLLDCLSDQANRPSQHACYGIVAASCEARLPNATIGSVACWVEEYFAWNSLMTTTYNMLIAEVGGGPYAAFVEPIQTSQLHWETQRDLDCALVVSSNPQTYETVRPACLARVTMERYLFLGELTGADWWPL